MANNQAQIEDFPIKNTFSTCISRFYSTNRYLQLSIIVKINVYKKENKVTGFQLKDKEGKLVKF